jgi:uncharacterized protein (DUF885 family)
MLDETAALLAEAGLTRGSPAERLGRLADRPDQLYGDDDRGRDQTVEDMNRWLARARRWSATAFRAAPDAMATVAVRRISAADEAAGRGGHRGLPTADSAGGYWVDLHAIRARPRWSLPSVVHHELLPGHLLQLATAAPAQAHPIRARFAAGYAEGWAIYAEHLAAERGAFSGDPLARIGYLQWRLFRLARVAADTGVNDQGWSAERARRLFQCLVGRPTAIASFDADVAAVVARPAALAAEGAAALELDRMRRHTEAKLGEAFDIRSFHEIVLRHGPLPIDLVEQELAGWTGGPPP